MTGCAADANSWLGLWPKRVRAWRFRQGSRLASSVKGVAQAASCVTRGAVLPAGRGRRAKSARADFRGWRRKACPWRASPQLRLSLSRDRKPPRVEPAWLLAAESTARSEECEDGPAERRASCAVGAATQTAPFRRSPRNALPVRQGGIERPLPSPLPPRAICGSRGPEL